MRKFLWLGLSALLAAMLALGLTFTAQTLPVSGRLDLAIPQTRGPEGMRVHALLAGKMFSPAAMAFRGGSFSDERVFGMGALLVRHPQGMLLFDTGFGRNVESHLKTTPWLLRASARLEQERSVAEQLEHAGIRLADLTAIVLTHAHWDHVSGLEDLPGVPVWATQPELNFVNGGDPASRLARELGSDRYATYDFAGGPYLGFERSHDVFGDGSVVLVPAPGHTPGSIIAFIHPPQGKRYALVGDLVWQSEGIDLPAERPWASRLLVDDDPAQVREVIVRMHQLQSLMPDLLVVPAHDRRVWEQLPRL